MYCLIREHFCSIILDKTKTEQLLLKRVTVFDVLLYMACSGNIVSVLLKIKLVTNITAS